jgi:beta-galactosidase/beta-glucuronidase
MTYHFTAFATIALALCANLFAEAIKVELKADGDNYQLLRDGKPYFIKGAGGDGSKPFLVECGGNSFRTWGVGDDTQAKLDEAQKLGLTVTLGIWLGHERHGFNYGNPEQVKKQFDNAREMVRRFKDHPAVLMWSVGNEMEGFKEGDNVAVWAAVQQIAAMIQREDPNHPVMTVIAEIGGQRVPMIHDLCPAIDIIGINSYGGGPSIAERYRKAGGTKPFILTEFGPPGTWEIGKNE